MSLQTLDSHTVDVDLIPEAPVVLDVGCRWWGFTREILRLRPRARIIALDPDRNIEDPIIPGCEYWRLALSDRSETTDYEAYYTGVGNFLKVHASPYLEQQAASYTKAGDGERYKVRTIDIQSLMRECNVTHWDLVKLDCEASEFPILEAWPGPIATQISVEFHDYVHRTQWNDAYFKLLLGKLAQHGYRVIQHEDQYVGGGWGHWDSLLAL